MPSITVTIESEEFDGDDGIITSTLKVSHTLETRDSGLAEIGNCLGFCIERIAPNGMRALAEAVAFFDSVPDYASSPDAEGTAEFRFIADAQEFIETMNDIANSKEADDEQKGIEGTGR